MLDLQQLGKNWSEKEATSKEIAKQNNQSINQLQRKIKRKTLQLGKKENIAVQIRRKDENKEDP